MVAEVINEIGYADLPCRFREVEHVWIPMSDGVRLSARIWIPDGAESEPVPAILEYIPYRKRDGTRAGDDPRYRFWAGHGYACIRLDIRGTGESEGLITDEYALQEQDDAVEAIAWIAAQEWCSGNVGMTGISWGGFNSLQVAARRPPALKAIITHCSTDDRYADDVHFMGGCLLGDNFFWGTSFFTFMARAGDPEIQGEHWFRQWMKRLENWEPVQSTIWQQHQQRDGYWKHGSVCEDYSDITCAVYAVGGWNDGYSNAVPRLLENLTAPAKGLVGPWGHKYPHDAIPGPSIGFLQHALRWWDHWLKGVDTGIMEEPAYCVWNQVFQKPGACVDMAAGSWIQENSWPSPNVDRSAMYLDDGCLRDSPGDGRERAHRSPLTIGAGGGVWCPYGIGGSSPDLTLDQREDDGKSLVYESDVLSEPVSILGAPELTLDLAIDKPQGMIVVRLNDVAPDGTSMRATYGMLNLSQRDDREHASSMTPGKSEQITIRLNDCAHRFGAGHRIRVAISTSYYPVAWPSPEWFVATIRENRNSKLSLPVRRTPENGDEHRPFEPPCKGPDTTVKVLVPGNSERLIEKNAATGEQVTRLIEDHGAHVLVDLDLECADGSTAEFRIMEDDPLSARAQWDSWSRRKRGNWEVEVRTRTEVAVSKDAYHIANDLHAFHNGRRIFSRHWNNEVPRHYL